MPPTGVARRLGCGRGQQWAAAIGAGQIAGGDQVGQRFPHPAQVGDPGLCIGLAGLGQRPGGVAAVRATAVKVQQLLNLVEGEAEFLGAFDDSAAPARHMGSHG